MYTDNCTEEIRQINLGNEIFASVSYNRSFLFKVTQWAFGAKMAPYRRRCDVITSHRR